MHSPLGASGAERWMNCHGSVDLIRNLQLVETDEPEYRADGTLAHAALCECLMDGLDGWVVARDPEMAAAVQVFIDVARPLMKGAKRIYIEEHMAAPEFHPDFYGTVDFAAITDEDVLVHRETVLTVLDFKYGEGVVVETEFNPQIMYYAYGILRNHPEVTKVRLAIIQPRVTWHPGGVVRWWETDAETIRGWAENVLRPAMNTKSSTLKAGDWCRFCPAKLVCPMLTSLFGAAATADEREIPEWTDEEAGRQYPLIEAVKHYINAVRADAFRRLQQGAQIATLKLVHQKANRVFKPEAEAIIKLRLGDDAYTKPELRSPAQIEKLGAIAKELVKEYAYTPESQLTVALVDDNRPAAKVTLASERFKGDT